MVNLNGKDTHTDINQLQYGSRCFTTKRIQSFFLRHKVTSNKSLNSLRKRSNFYCKKNVLSIN